MTQNKRLLATFVVCLGAVLGLTAATKGDNPSKATNGVTQVSAYDGGTVSADGGVQPTKLFTALLGRNTFAIYNNGPATIWCGWRSNVTTLTGFPIVASGFLSIDHVYGAAGDNDFYCVATNGRDQDAPADTRWIQVK